MSLVGFKAQNHRQQVGKRGPNPTVDDRATTPEDFAVFHERFNFTIDVAASAENAKLPRFYTAEQDGLARSWAGERVFCNPPYSSIEPWCEKALAESSDRYFADEMPAQLVVMLLPANRTEQGWWQRWIEPGRREGSIEVEFLAGRMRFLAPGESTVPPNSRPPFGCCLVIWGNEETAA